MNKAMVIGNLGNDPEVCYTQNEIPVATFSVASTERWKDSDGNKQEGTTRYTTETNARELEMLGGRQDGAGSLPNGNTAGDNVEPPMPDDVSF